MEAKEYEVTERAGRKVAGRVVAGPGATLRLTEAEAEHAVLAGELVPAGEALSAAFTRDSDVLAGMRADAEAVGGRPRPGPPAALPAAELASASAEVPGEPAPAAADAETARRRSRPQPAAEPAAAPSA